jgi:hypothetical protein
MRILEERPQGALLTKVHHMALAMRRGDGVQTHIPNDEVTSIVVKPSSNRCTAQFRPTSWSTISGRQANGGRPSTNTWAR